jgi:hypothetical protein
MASSSFINTLFSAIKAHSEKKRLSRREQKREIVKEQFKPFYSINTMYGYDPEMDVESQEDAEMFD